LANHRFVPRRFKAGIDNSMADFVGNLDFHIKNFPAENRKAQVCKIVVPAGPDRINNFDYVF